jgi:hypothetical protein
VTRRRRTVAYVVTVGTRAHLARGADPDHALELIQRRYAFPLDRRDVVIRAATVTDLELTDLIGGDADEVRAWRDAARRQTAVVDA